MERLTVRHPITIHTSASSGPTPVIFEGYASVFHVLIEAHVPTIIEPGAFKKTLQEQRGRIVLLWQHDSDVPVGRPLELFEDRVGLFLKGRLSTTPRALEAGTLLKDGTLNEMSVGFDPIQHYMDGTTRHLTEVRLWEISLVTFAANHEARVSAVHSRRQPDQRSVTDQLIDLELAVLDADLAAMDRRSGTAAIGQRDVVSTVLDLELDYLDTLLRRLP